MPNNYNLTPFKFIKSKGKDIAVYDIDGENIDLSVVQSFGEEWNKFYHFHEIDLQKLKEEYFDILDEKIINKSSYCLDAGCGSGRYTKVLADKVYFFESVDPSEAIFAASDVLQIYQM
jgi:SAM-dependent methyltransferase